MAPGRPASSGADTEMVTVEVPCSLCGRDGKGFHVESGWRLLRCPSCTFLYVSPRPDGPSLRRHYRDYLPTSEEEIAGWDRMMAGIHRRVVGDLRARVGKGRVLDVGCGFGFLLRNLGEAGFDVEGTDISPTALHHCRDALGLPVREGTLEEAGFEEESFEAVTALYIIEHVPDPLAFLREVHRILRPGGLLLLRWPHTAPITALLRPFGIDLRLHDLPSHLSDFSPATMRFALERAGFHRIRTGVGGWTRPLETWKRWPSLLGGVAAGAVAAVTFGRLLLPGVSKTTVAYSP